MIMFLPELPEITDPQGARILAAIKGIYGATTNAEAVVAYRRHMMRHLRDLVLNYEDGVLAAEQAAVRSAKLETSKTELPSIP